MVIWVSLLGCGVDTDAVPPSTPGGTGDTAAESPMPLPEPDLIQSLAYLDRSWSSDSRGDFSVDVARVGVEVCVVTTKVTTCSIASASTGCVKERLHAIPEPFHVTAHDDQGVLLDCVVVDGDGDAPAGCRPMAVDDGIPPACLHYEPRVDVECGPTATTLDVWGFEGNTYDAHVTGTDETGIVVDAVLTVHSIYEATYGCTDLPACPPAGLTWTITKLGTDTCAMAAPEFDAAWPCSQTGPVEIRAPDEDPECWDPTTW